LLSFAEQSFVFHFLSNNLKIKIYITLNVLVVLYGCETWPLKLREKSRLSVFENGTLGRISGPKGDEGTGEWKNYTMKSLMIYTPQPVFFG
jgi:hypothetical protein